MALFPASGGDGSATPKTVTYTTNSYVSNANFSMDCYEVNGLYVIQLNIKLTSMPSGTAALEIASISNYSAKSELAFNLPSRYKDYGNLGFQISTSGVVKIWNEYGSAAVDRYRGNFVTVKA